MTEEQKDEGIADRSGINRYLGRFLRIELTDGRIIKGRFVCTDNVPNVILSGCQEQWRGSNEIRTIGLAMITGKHIQSVHLLEHI